MVVGKTAKVGRRAPDEKVSPYEKQRLVNMATKLIVATVSFFEAFTSNLFPRFKSLLYLQTFFMP